MRTKLQKALMLAFIFCVYSSFARADSTYTFIEMKCDPDSRIATIKTYYENNEEGLTKANNLEKDTYYLSAISKSKEKVPCNIGDDQTVSFSAAEGQLPKDNHFSFYINGKRITHGHPLGYGPWTMTITKSGKTTYDLKYCPDFADGSFVSDVSAFYAKKKCQISHVESGKLTGSEIVDR
jgi:hypothetical protein